jgi:hypothetical protein
MRLRAACTCLCILTLGTLSVVRADSLRVMATRANIRLKPTTQSALLLSVSAGTVLEVVEKEGDWYAVILPPDSDGLTRVGYVAAALVEFVVSPSSDRQKAQSAPVPVPPPVPEVDRARNRIDRGKPSLSVDWRRAAIAAGMTEQSVKQAVSEGAAKGLRNVGVQMNTVSFLRRQAYQLLGPNERNTSFGHMTLFMPALWVQRLSGEAAFNLKEFDEQDLTPNVFKPVLRILMHFDANNVVLRSLDKSAILQPATLGPYEGLIPLKGGLETTNLQATFLLSDIRAKLLSHGSDGFVVSVVFLAAESDPGLGTDNHKGEGKRDIEVKGKDFAHRL